jgi:hypothetical protein
MSRNLGIPKKFDKKDVPFGDPRGKVLSEDINKLVKGVEESALPGGDYAVNASVVPLDETLLNLLYGKDSDKFVVLAPNVGTGKMYFKTMVGEETLWFVVDAKRAAQGDVIPSTSIFNLDGSWNDAGIWNDNEIYTYL